MITIDTFFKTSFPKIKHTGKDISSKDRRILTSFFNQLNIGHFFTENQAKLLVKIIRENKIDFEKVEPDFDSILNENLWSEKFRIVEKIRKIFISEKNPEHIGVKFTFDKRLKDKIINLNSKISGNVIKDGNEYFLPLNEQNIFALIDTFRKDKFDIDEKILNFYQEISKIIEQAQDPYDIFITDNEKIRSIVKNHVAEISKENLLLLHDRKIRHQYTISEKFEAKTLVEKIATRNSEKIYINSDHYSLTEVVTALKILKRFPLLTIFEGHNTKPNKRFLDLLKKSLDDNEIFEKIGIYFRFDSSTDTDNFNTSIAEYRYNYNLDDTTQVAGISNHKIPKFMVKSGWKPQTVISFTNSFRNTKSYVYCNDVDLIVYYGAVQPLGGEISAIV